MHFFIFFLSIATTSLAPAYSAEKFQAIEVARVDGIPWSFVFIDNKNILVANRNGTLHYVNLDTKKELNKMNVPHVAQVGQGGLLDLKKHPDFQNNKTIYYTYSKSTGGGYTTVLASLNFKNGQATNFKDLFIAKAEGPASRHFGSRIAFNKEKNKLFLSIGDRGERDKAQSLSFHNGKILRLNLDGTTPKDNPFAEAPAIYSFGHRNPQGLVFIDKYDTLFEQEHGPRGGDEINVILKGKNYGWPVITYGKEYWGPKIGEGTKKKGLEQPIKFYVPSIAPCGLFYYEGSKYPAWNGSLLNGALKLKHLNRVKISQKKQKFFAEEEERVFENLNKRIRYITQGPNQDDYLYMTSDDGGIYQIK